MVKRGLERLPGYGAGSRVRETATGTRTGPGVFTCPSPAASDQRVNLPHTGAHPTGAPPLAKSPDPATVGLPLPRLGRAR